MIILGPAEKDGMFLLQVLPPNPTPKRALQFAGKARPFLLLITMKQSVVT